jgi:hypothetical protein
MHMVDSGRAQYCPCTAAEVRTWQGSWVVAQAGERLCCAPAPLLGAALPELRWPELEAALGAHAPLACSSKPSTLGPCDMHAGCASQSRKRGAITQKPENRVTTCFGLHIHEMAKWLAEVRQQGCSPGRDTGCETCSLNT